MSKLIEGENKPRNKNPLLFQHPCRGVICGSSGTGKTRFILEDIVLHKDSPLKLSLFFPLLNQ